MARVPFAIIQTFAFLSRFRWSVEHIGALDYAVTYIGRKPVFMQHLILMKMHNAKVIHLDGNGLNIAAVT